MRGWSLIICYIVGLLTFALMMMLSFFLGRCTAKKCTDGFDELPDTVVVRDTIKIDPKQLPAQLAKKDVVKYKKVPVLVTDTFIERDTIIQVVDGVASIPITRKTYTDSATYKAVVSGYDSRLESMEIYRDNLVVTKWKQKHWNFGLGATTGVSVTTGHPDVVFGFYAGYSF